MTKQEAKNEYQKIDRDLKAGLVTEQEAAQQREYVRQRAENPTDSVPAPSWSDPNA